ncbi:OsmC family protein [Pseudoroseomonas cervicalis]|uniref:OsmC family protein n=1 Tax=Teichococcus cervicalis TaxID=204525 RepID=UPI0027843574|nr:OsmC family protein [Pseudoroseomonas cervicalis]MDQ1081755.1 putative redox protein [Pseudoroseomonas cervicalis]
MSPPAEAAPSDAAHSVTVAESGLGPYGQIIRAGRHLAVADEPEALGGLDSGPTPFEHVMSGLGACTAITLRMYAARKSWPLQRVVVRVRQAPPQPGARPRFLREIALLGALDAEQRVRLLQIAGRCPVHLLLESGAEIATGLAEDLPAPATPPG